MPASEPEPKQMDNVTVYGLSSEGYQIASKLAAKGYSVAVIDETLGTAMELRPEIAGDYRDLRSLLADEVLMSIKSSKECISKSRAVFFMPKLRRRDEDLLAEVKSRLSEVSKNLSIGSLFVFCLPLGMAGTKEIIDRIEHASGLVNGKDVFFAYCPLDSGKPTVFGSDSKLASHGAIIEAAGLSMEVVGLSKAELVHAQRMVAKFSSLASAFETAKRLTQMEFDSPREYKQVYVDELSGCLFDLRLIVESLETGDPVLYLVSGSLKSIDSYTRFLVERIRDFVRVKELKASRLKILLFTDSDSLEMRGDRVNTALAVLDRLRDFFSDIEYQNIMKEGFSPPMGLDRTNLLIFLSGSAEQRITQLYEDQISMTKSHMVRANLPVEFIG